MKIKLSDLFDNFVLITSMHSNNRNDLSDNEKMFTKKLEYDIITKLKDKRISLDNYAKLLRLQRLVHEINCWNKVGVYRR